MSFSYQFLKAAQRDYEESIIWYNEKSVTVADNFIAALEKSLQVIACSPTVYKKGYKGHYQYLMKVFQFTILYSVEEKKHLIIIRAIYHQKRNPRNKYR